MHGAERDFENLFLSQHQLWCLEAQQGSSSPPMMGESQPVPLVLANANQQLYLGFHARGFVPLHFPLTDIQ